MSFLSQIRERAKKDPKRIVLPDGDDKRVIEAKAYISKSKIAETILIRKNEQIEGIDRIIDQFFEIRRKQDMTKEDIEKTFLQKKDWLHLPVGIRF